MKADQLRFIYECLSGDNGLLGKDKETLIDVTEHTGQRYLDNQNQDTKLDQVDCKIYDKIHKVDETLDLKTKLDEFYSKEMSLLTFLEHDVIFEYEKVKD